MGTTRCAEGGLTISHAHIADYTDATMLPTYLWEQPLVFQCVSLFLHLPLKE